MSGFLINETIMRDNNAKAFVRTFAVFQNVQIQVKNYKRANDLSHIDTSLHSQSMTEKEGRRHNRHLAQWPVT